MHYEIVHDTHCLRLGSRRSSPPVVLLHGFGMDHKSWLPWALAHKGEREFILVDLPGFGRSRAAVCKELELLPAYAERIEHIRKHFGIERFLLGGFSLGAYASLQYLTTGGDAHVAGYLHVDHAPWTRGEEGMAPGLLEKIRRVVEAVEKDPAQRAHALTGLAPEIYDLYAEVLASLAGFGLTSKLLGNVMRGLYKTPKIRELLVDQGAWPWAYATMYHYWHGTYDFRAAARGIAAPVTLVGGERSELFAAAWMEGLAAKIADVKLHRFAGSAHDLMFKQPLKFNSLFKSFLRDPRHV